MMRRLGVRHLPVLDGGKLAGVLSQRIRFVEAVRRRSEEPSRRRGHVPGDVQRVSRRADPDVAREMGAEVRVCRDHGGAVVRGIFTTTDALKALSTLLAG